VIALVISDILNVLKSDANLQSLIGNKIHAFSTAELNSIAYDYVDLTSNKIIGQSRLTLTINSLAVDYSLNIQILNRVKQLLLTLADEQLNNSIIEIEQNGGGIMRNDETATIHNKAIFTIKYKEG
jgi:hypothetical protein